MRYIRAEKNAFISNRADRNGFQVALGTRASVKYKCFLSLYNFYAPFRDLFVSGPTY